MPDTALTNQLPPRPTTSTRGSRKWSTLGGRGTSPTIVPTNNSDVNENISKPNGQPRRSTSLFRKSSTISRTNDTPVTSDGNTSTSLKKSRSLMNVIRSKLNSPAVLRRFRSKSRESTKQTVTDINGHTINDEQQDIKQSNTEQISTRKSRKREPSPMRRLANCISQLTRHQRPASTERKKKSPSKSVTNDSHEEPRKTSSPLHNKDEVDHINACYDEIRAKYFNNNNKTTKQNTSNDDTQNRSLLSNDFFTNSQHINLPLPPTNDPLLQARKQSNIKLNCMLSGYNLTKSFANHEKLFGQNDLFKFHHYYDVGTRKYDWNFTNNNNRIFSSMRTRPISKSIDNFRHPNANENQIPIKLDQINIVDNDPLIQVQNHRDVPRILPNDNELVIREDSDLIQSKQNTSQYSTNIHETPIVQTSSILFDENQKNSNEQNVEEHDEEFERNFLRAVDRALGVVNKDENDLTQLNDDIPTKTEESHLNLVQITERALSSLNNSSLFANDNQKNDENIVENKEQINNDTALTNTEVFDHTAEPLNNEELSKVNMEKQEEAKPTNTELSKADIEKQEETKPMSDELSKVDIEKQVEAELAKEELSKVDIEKQEEAQPTNDELSKVNIEKQEEAQPTKEELPKVDIEKQEEAKPTNDELSKVDIEKQVEAERTKEELSKVDIEKQEGPKPASDELLKVDVEKQEEAKTTSDELSKIDIEKQEGPKPASDELPKVDVEKQEEAKPTHDELSKVDIEKQEEAKPTSDELPKVDTENQEEAKTTSDELSKVDAEKQEEAKPTTDELSKVDIEKQEEAKPTSDELSKVDTEKQEETKPTHDELSKVDIEKQEEAKPSNDELINEYIRSVIDDLVQKVEESLFEETKNGQTFLTKLDDEEKTIKSKAEAYNKLLQSDDNRLTEDVRTDISAVIGEVNLLLKGKLKQFRGLCEANVTKSTSGEPIPLDSDLEGFWDITYPLIDKVKEKFGKLDARKAKQWAPIEEYDPDDVNNRPRVIDDRLKQLQPQQNKSSKSSVTKSANDDLKKLIQERRKAAANTANQNHDIEIFVAPK